MKENRLTINWNIQFIYNAAFLYYNLRGIVAERWGHEYFKRYSDNIGQLLLENNEDLRSCTYGLKSANIFLQNLSVKSFNKEIEIVKELIQDIIKSIQIVQITYVEVRSFYIYEPDKKIDLFSEINNKFSKNQENFFPELAKYNDIGLAFEFSINKFKHNFMFGPFVEKDIKRVARFPVEKKIENSLLLNYATYISQEDIAKKITEQSIQIDKIIDLNYDYGIRQLKKILEILETE